jgi:hypothetical protein
MRHRQSLLFLFSCLAAMVLFTACQQTDTKPRTEWTEPLPDLNKVEQCQRADLSRYYNSTFRFHLYDCWADVSIDSMGRVTAFKPDDAETCEKVLASC